MREYESVFVLNPTVDDAQVDAELAKIKEFLASRGSEVTEVQKWGRRKLAYEVKKNREGIYTLIRFSAETGVPTELDRRYRLNENMLRYLTVLYERPSAEEAERAASGEEKEDREGGRREAAPPREAAAKTPEAAAKTPEAPAKTPETPEDTAPATPAKDAEA